MSKQTKPLHIEYRPTTWDEVVGNEETVAALRVACERKEGLPHALLFTGPSGCGKTTLARLAADHIGCADSDCAEIDAADYRGIDTVRELRQQMHLAPLQGEYRVYILDEAHQLSKDAQNGLLKALEDTPSHVVFMLCTTHPERLLPTIRNRCTRFPVAMLGVRDLATLVEEVLQEEGDEYDPALPNTVACAAEGSPRQALVIADAVRLLPVAEQDAAVVKGQYSEASTKELCQALFKGAEWPKVAKLLASLEVEPETVRRAVLGYASAVVLRETKKEKLLQAYTVLRAMATPLYDTGKPGLVLACMECVFGG